MLFHFPLSLSVCRNLRPWVLQCLCLSLSYPHKILKQVAQFAVEQQIVYFSSPILRLIVQLDIPILRNIPSVFSSNVHHGDCWTFKNCSKHQSSDGHHLWDGRHLPDLHRTRLLSLPGSRHQPLPHLQTVASHGNHI